MILSDENGFGGDFSARFTKSIILDFVKGINGVVARFIKKSPDFGLKTIEKIRPHGFCKSVVRHGGFFTFGIEFIHGVVNALAENAQHGGRKFLKRDRNFIGVLLSERA